LQAEEIGADGGDVGRGRGKHGRSDHKRRTGTASENENDFGAGSDAPRASRPQRESPAGKALRPRVAGLDDFDRVQVRQRG
jgi:hypothetical protein